MGVGSIGRPFEPGIHRACGERPVRRPALRKWPAVSHVHTRRIPTDAGRDFGCLFRGPRRPLHLGFHGCSVWMAAGSFGRLGNGALSGGSIAGGIADARAVSNCPAGCRTLRLCAPPKWAAAQRDRDDCGRFHYLLGTLASLHRLSACGGPSCSGLGRSRSQESHLGRSSWLRDTWRLRAGGDFDGVAGSSLCICGTATAFA